MNSWTQKRIDDAYCEGYAAYYGGIKENPYKYHMGYAYQNWHRGWHAAQKACMAKQLS